MNEVDAGFAHALAAYAARWPEESATVALFAELLGDARDPFLRERLAGHFTASCWLVDRGGGRVLLTHHKKLGFWLQLGGHADGERDLRRAALKEAEEESGLADLRIEDGISRTVRPPFHLRLSAASSCARQACNPGGNLEANESIHGARASPQRPYLGAGSPRGGCAARHIGARRGSPR